VIALPCSSLRQLKAASSKWGNNKIRKEGLKLQAIDTKSFYKLSRKGEILYEKI
jgi:hypothetical protein